MLPPNGHCLFPFFTIHAIFLSSAYCFFQDGHIRIDILLDKLGNLSASFYINKLCAKRLTSVFVMLERFYFNLQIFSV